MKYGFLFDIDGCLTLEGHSTSILDIDLIDRILEFQGPVAFVTGRSDGWLKKHYRLQDRANYLSIPTYIEFGLALIHEDKLIIQENGSEFLETREKLIEALDRRCRRSDVYFEDSTWYNDYPEHGSLWIEKKHVMLSIAANREIQPQTVHQLIDDAWHNLDVPVRILHHHLGVDALPQGWSKSKATQQFLQKYEIDEQEYQWYVFGDNDSDREMMKGLSRVEFVSTTEHASTIVRHHLEQIMGI